MSKIENGYKKANIHTLPAISEEMIVNFVILNNRGDAKPK